ncbi:MAG TPA: DUF3592 domain-containing protein [Propionibacteriaceae bacterium]|nr:DUF3592 domain-containing protein [Propionibacteriaceae bacterium]
MKVVKILGVVIGGLFLLTGLALLAGSALFGAGQGEFDRQLAEQGLAGPVEGRVTAIDGPIFTVDYTDKTGAARTGTGPVAEGTTPPEQGDDVEVYYSTLDPRQVIILDFPGGNFAGVSGLLRTIAFICVAIGVILLTAGIIGLVTGRRRTPVTAGPAGYPDVPPPGQTPEGQPPPPSGQTPAGASYPPAATGPDIDPTPTEPFPRNPHDPPTQASDPEFNRPGG